MPYCPHCGAENEADAAFCESCGARLEGAAPARPTPGGGLRWTLLAAILLLAALAGGGAAAFILLGGGGDSEESMVSASETPAATRVAEATATTRPEATDVPEATAPPAPTLPPETPTVPPPLGYATPEDAIAGRVAPSEYAGDCSATTVEEDAGKVCSSFYGGSGSQLVYAVGLTFSEFGAWLLLEQQADGTWLTVDSSPVGMEMESPWPVPPSSP